MTPTTLLLVRLQDGIYQVKNYQLTSGGDIVKGMGETGEWV